MTGRRRVERPAFRITAIATFALLAPFASLPQAQAADSPWYVGFQIPVMFIDDTESTTTGSNMIPGIGMMSYSAKATSEYEAGFKLAGMVGYRLGGNLRVEGELFFARARVDRQTYGNIVSAGNPVPVKVNVPISGSASQTGGMANVWFDIPTGSDWTPYVGGGIGFVRVDQGDLEYDANALANRLAKLNDRNAPDFPPGFVPGDFIDRYLVRLAYRRRGRLPARRQDGLAVRLPPADCERPGVRRSERAWQRHQRKDGVACAPVRNRGADALLTGCRSGPLLSAEGRRHSRNGPDKRARFPLLCRTGTTLSDLAGAAGMR